MNAYRFLIDSQPLPLSPLLLMLLPLMLEKLLSLTHSTASTSDADTPAIVASPFASPAAAGVASVAEMFLINAMFHVPIRSSI